MNEVISLKDLQAQIASLKAQLADANKPRAITLKVSEKGALSMYGIGRFPVTLYRGQWERILGNAEAIKAFIVANTATLSVKA